MRWGRIMIAILGAFLFTIVAGMTILVAFGAPFGEFTMGGKYKVLPKELRIMAFVSFIVQMFAIIIILQHPCRSWRQFAFGLQLSKYHRIVD